jgi:hypothetical protein
VDDDAERTDGYVIEAEKVVTSRHRDEACKRAVLRAADDAGEPGRLVPPGGFVGLVGPRTVAARMAIVNVIDEDPVHLRGAEIVVCRNVDGREAASRGALVGCRSLLAGHVV